MRLLLIDDDETVARALERCLSTEHEVRFEKNAAQAVDEIRAGERFDAILCDVVMPRMTGQEVHEAVSSIDREQARRIVFVSGRVHEVGCRIGKIACLPKPFELTELRSVIGRFLPIRLHGSSTSLRPARKPITS
jgi:CheY-like chemotaxis protein